MPLVKSLDLSWPSQLAGLPLRVWLRVGKAITVAVYGTGYVCFGLICSVERALKHFRVHKVSCSFAASGDTLLWWEICLCRRRFCNKFNMWPYEECLCQNWVSSLANNSVYYAPADGALSDDARLTSVCLTSVAYIGPKSRTERPRKTKIGTEVAHVTHDSDTTFKVKMSKVKVTCEAGAYCGGLPQSLFYCRCIVVSSVMFFIVCICEKHYNVSYTNMSVIIGP